MSTFEPHPWYVGGVATKSQRDVTLDSIWSRLFPLFIGKRDSFFRAMGEHGLTPPHGMALTMLVDGPRRMRDIADQMVCDASYVTAIVDRLEELGLATRQPSATDRRVKEIALTTKGKAAAAEIQGAMSAAPAALGALSEDDLETLETILAKLEPPAVVGLWPKSPFRHEH